MFTDRRSVFVLPPLRFNTAPIGITVRPPPSIVPTVQSNVPVTVNVPTPSTVPPANSRFDIATAAATTSVPAVTRAAPAPLTLAPAFNVYVDPPKFTLVPSTVVNAPVALPPPFSATTPLSTATVPTFVTPNPLNVVVPPLIALRSVAPA